MKYRMPAEWESHEATWLAWPKNKITWPGKMLARVEEIYLQMISGLLPGEKVQLLVDDDKTAKKVLSRLPRKAQTQRLIFHKVKTVDTWIRDYGPIFVKKLTGPTGARLHGFFPMVKSADASVAVTRQFFDLAFTKWIFNAWGGKYSDLARDNKVVDKISYLKNFRRFEPGIIMEGGSIDVNGRGTLLTTEQCLLNKNRNRNRSKKQIENYLKRFLGVSKIIWLKEGIEGDDTDGHVDDITRFVGPRKILTAVETDQTDKNYGYLKENLEILAKETDQDGKKILLIELPMPGRVGPARRDSHHPRLPASYANFYIGNAAVLLPVYSHTHDKEAYKILKKVFSSRRVIPIECSALVYGLGSIHCVTQQEPR